VTMAVEIVFETHSLTTDNEAGVATGWLGGQLSERGPAAAANNGYGVDDDAVAALRGAIDQLGFTVRVGADASLEVASTSPAGRAPHLVPQQHLRQQGEGQAGLPPPAAARQA
jgi:hypothetical protein